LNLLIERFEEVTYTSRILFDPWLTIGGALYSHTVEDLMFTGLK